MRAFCLALNAAPHPEIFAEFSKYLEWYISKHPEYNYVFREVIDELKVDITCRETFARLYLGLESKQLGFQSMLGSSLVFCWYLRIMHEYENFKNNMVARAARVDQELLGNPKFSPDGKISLIQMLDPFHDTKLPRNAGWPTGGVGRTNKYRVTKSMALCKPDSITGTWDLSVVNWPWLSPTKMTALHDRTNNRFACDDWGDQSKNIWGGITTHTCVSGTDMNYISGTDATKTGSGSGLLLDPQYTQGSGRLVGWGFELCNTTPVLSRGGNCCVYRQTQPEKSPFTAERYVHDPGFRPVIKPPQPRKTFVHDGSESEEGNIKVGESWTFSDSGSYSFVRLPPINLSDAMAFPNSQQWGA